jgi:ATP-dependent DNA ligase
MTRDLAELKSICQQLGLTVKQLGRKESKEDYFAALREYYLKRDFPQGLPYQELEPMLAFNFKDLTPAEQEVIWQDNNGWVAQTKLNGARIILHFIKGVGVFAQTRTVSMATYRRTEVTEHLLFHDFVPDFTATVDCEAVVDKPIDTRGYTGKGEVTKTGMHSVVAILHIQPAASRRLQQEQDAAIHFHAFDLVNWQGQDLKCLSLHGRLQYVDQFEAVIKATPIGKYFEFPSLVWLDKKVFYEQIVKNGGEGVVLKNLRSPYLDFPSRRRGGWVKVKARIEFDAFVSGFERGDTGAWRNLVGALQFSVHTERGDHIIAVCINMSLAERQALTIYDPVSNTVTMRPWGYRRVAEVSGVAIAPRVLRLIHARIERWREGVDAKNADECVASYADLVERASWVQ